MKVGTRLQGYAWKGGHVQGDEEEQAERSGGPLGKGTQPRASHPWLSSAGQSVCRGPAQGLACAPVAAPGQDSGCFSK